MKSHMINMKYPIIALLFMIALAGSLLLFTFIPEIPTDYEAIEDDMVDFDYCQELDDSAKFDCFEYFNIGTTDRDEYWQDSYKTHDMKAFLKFLGVVIYTIIIFCVYIAIVVDEDNRFVLFRYKDGGHDSHHNTENGKKQHERVYRRNY